MDQVSDEESWAGLEGFAAFEIDDPTSTSFAGAIRDRISAARTGNQWVSLAHLGMLPAGAHPGHADFSSFGEGIHPPASAAIMGAKFSLCR